MCHKQEQVPRNNHEECLAHATIVNLDEISHKKHDDDNHVLIMVMVINEEGTMRTSSILVKSLTKTFTRTKVADPVAFAPGGLFNKTQY